MHQDQGQGQQGPQNPPIRLEARASRESRVSLGEHELDLVPVGVVEVGNVRRSQSSTRWSQSKTQFSNHSLKPSKISVAPFHDSSDDDDDSDDYDNNDKVGKDNKIDEDDSGDKTAAFAKQILNFKAEHRSSRSRWIRLLIAMTSLLMLVPLAMSITAIVKTNNLPEAQRSTHTLIHEESGINLTSLIITIANLKNQIAEQNSTLQRLQTEDGILKHNIVHLNAKDQHLTRKDEDHSSELQELEEKLYMEVMALKMMGLGSDPEFIKILTKLVRITTNITNLNTQAADLYDKLTALHERLNSSHGNMTHENMTDYEEKFQELEMRIEWINDTIANLSQQAAALDDEFEREKDNRTSTLFELQKSILRLQNEDARLGQQNSELRKDITSLNATIQALKSQLSDQNSALKKLRMEDAKLEGEIAKLNIETSSEDAEFLSRLNLLQLAINELTTNTTNTIQNLREQISAGYSELAMNQTTLYKEILAVSEYLAQHVYSTEIVFG